MADQGIRVTAVDLETGGASEITIKPGNYVIVAAAPCHVAGEQHHANGTTVLTLKGRSPGLMGLADVRGVPGDGCGPSCDPATCVHMYDEHFPGVPG